MNSQLFQYAVIWHPTPKQQKEGEKSKLIKEITNVFVKDQQTAAMTAMMNIPQEYKDQLDQIEIPVRPF